METKKMLTTPEFMCHLINEGGELMGLFILQAIDQFSKGVIENAVEFRKKAPEGFPIDLWIKCATVIQEQLDLQTKLAQEQEAQDPQVAQNK